MYNFYWKFFIAQYSNQCKIVLFLKSGEKQFADKLFTTFKISSMKTKLINKNTFSQHHWSHVNRKIWLAKFSKISYSPMLFLSFQFFCPMVKQYPLSIQLLMKQKEIVVIYFFLQALSVADWLCAFLSITCP